VSIFLGGGTPSLFSPVAIGRFLEHARSVSFIEAVEVTLEATGTIGAAGSANTRGGHHARLTAQSLTPAN
jgi:oxygen-independent coproporphyrinogen-3 oxidase